MSVFREVFSIEEDPDAEIGIAVVMVNGDMEDNVGLMKDVKEADEELDDNAGEVWTENDGVSRGV